MLISWAAHAKSGCAVRWREAARYSAPVRPRIRVPLPAGAGCVGLVVVVAPFSVWDPSLLEGVGLGLTC
jgi:hypothetical protein